jgi:hypothetical protein
MLTTYPKLFVICACLYVFLVALISAPAHAGGQTYTHSKAHCVLWGEALEGKPAKCRRRANTAATSTTACRLKHQYQAKNNDTWCVYKKQGFFGDDKKILISTKHCPRTFQCNRKVRQ